MTVGEELFVSCLKRKDHKVLSVVQRKWLDGSEVRQYKFVMDYYREHGEMVGVKTFCEKFKLHADEVDSRPAFYLNALKERFIFATMSDNIPKILRGIKDDPREKLYELQSLVATLSVDAVESKDVLYSDDTESRIKDYEERMKSLGVTYLSMGCEDMDKVFYGYRKQDLITIGGRAGQGKCLGKGTKVLMYDLTTKNVEDVVVGDKLMGPDGTPRNVLSISRGREQMYWVRQHKGMDYRVNESHILSLKFPRRKSLRSTIGGKRRYCGSETIWETHNLSVKEYLKKGYTFKKDAVGYKSYGMTFEDTSLPLDPYFLGVWLGDGTSRELTITSFDLPIIRFLQEYAISWGGELKKEASNEGLYRMKGCKELRTIMDSFGLIKNRYKEDKGRKHIPMEFIKTSRENRLQLLAGLIDTDGHTRDNSFEITLVSKELSDDIKLLCRTLGFYVTQSIKIVNGKEYYRCNIQGKGTDEVPVKLSRKQANVRRQIKNVLHTGVTIEKDIVDDYYGFTIDGDHLFCLEDFTVTHNTWLLVYLTFLLERVLIEKESLTGETYGDILFITNEMGEEEIKERLDCIKFRLPYENFLKGTLTEREKGRYYRGLEGLKKERSKIRIVYSCQTIDELSTYIGLYQPSVVFIDGSYLMEGKMQEGWEKIVYITRNLKRIAKNFKVPVINTTQLKRGSNKSGSKFALDGQDDFAYSSSYTQDSDIAIRMFQDADMKFHDLIGCEVVKGRRVVGGTTLVFQNDLSNMCQSITLPADETREPERKTDF